MSETGEQQPPRSKFIGLILGIRSRRVYGVINPDSDEELDNPKHLLWQVEPKLREPVTMAKVERGAYEVSMTLEDVNTLVNTWYVTSSFVHEGKEEIGDL